jgi:hypothetical protein
MNLDRNPSKKEDVQLSGVNPLKSILTFLDQEIKDIDDFHKNLGTEYDKSTYEKFERKFIDLRQSIKGKLKDITDPGQEVLSGTKMRRDFAEEAIQHSTRAAESFQEARENNRLNRSKSTDAIEDVSIALKNLRNLIERQSKK